VGGRPERNFPYPLVGVNHGTSEEAGVRALADHLRASFPGIEVVHFALGCTHRFVPPKT